MISGGHAHPAGLPGAQINTGHFPYDHSWWAFASRGIGDGLHLGQPRHRPRSRDGLPDPEHRRHHRLPRLPLLLQAPAHLPGADQRGRLPAPRALGRLYKTPDMDMENVSEDTVFGAGHIEDLTWKQLLDFAPAPSAGGASRSARPGTRASPCRPKLLIMGLRDNLFASAARLLGAGRNGAEGDEAAAAAEVATLVPGTIDPDVLWSCTHLRGLRGGSARSTSSTSTPSSTCAATRCSWSRGSPGGGPLLRNIENQGDPWGLGCGQADRVDRGPRLRGPRHHRHHPRRHRVPLLGGLRRLPRRARPQGQPRPPPGCCTAPG